MKVKELILKLKRCNPEDEVYISDHIGDTLWRGCTVDGIGGGESSEHGHWATIYKGWKVARDGSINKDIRPSWTGRDGGHVDEIIKHLTCVAEEYELYLDDEINWLKDLRNRF